jgi:hypothetical protein
LFFFLDEMNKFVLKNNNFLKFNFFQRKKLAVQTPAIVNIERSDQGLEKSKVNGRLC